MRFVREMVRLHHEARLSPRPIARALQLSPRVISKYLAAARDEEVTWRLAPDLDAALQARLFPASPPPHEAALSNRVRAPCMQERSRSS